jgi:hypothetical protein
MIRWIPAIQAKTPGIYRSTTVPNVAYKPILVRNFFHKLSMEAQGRTKPKKKGEACGK